VKRLLITIGAVLLVMGGAAAGGYQTPAASAAQVTVEGVATGAEENPPVTSPGSVRVRFVFDDVAKTLTYSATVNGISQDQVLFAHIHRAARGVNGPIIHNLSLVPFTQISGTVNLSDADVADLRAGNLYFNAHSKDFPGGFARFQLTLPAAPAPAATTAPAGITAPSTGDGGLLGSDADNSASGWLPYAALIGLAGLGAGTLAFARRRA
jgi:hypothetical protein